jgi:hypothetical protein
MMISRRLRVPFAAMLSFVLLAMVLCPLASATIWPSHDTMGDANLEWSGRSWWVCDWGEYSASRVSVDSNGYLHLTQSGSSDAGIITYDQCGYGNYTFVMQGIHAIDKSAVIGMNPYLSVSTDAQPSHEADIEQSQWGDPVGTNFDFVTQPNSDAHSRYFTLPYTSADTTFVIDWQHSYIAYAVVQSGSVVYSWVNNVTRDASGVFGVINAWHYQQPTTTASSVVFKSFGYQANGAVADEMTNNTNVSSVEYWTLHWYYPVLIIGFLTAAIAGYTRHWLIFLLGVCIELFCYLYMMSGGVMVGWLTGTGLALWTGGF